MSNVDTRKILRALQGLSIQIMELEKRIDGLELGLKHPLFQLIDDAEESSSESGYESAPPTFSR